MINFDKSAACFSLKTDPITKQLISDMLGVRIVACHARYLGLPTVTQRNKYMMFSHVRDTLLQKLSTWNSKLLSTAGKEVLIKAVGQALPTYTKLLLSYVCLFKGRVKPKGDLQEKETGVQWQILKRWEVPWEWQTVSLTSLACGLSFILTGLVETAAVPYLGLRVQDLSIDEKAEILFLDQGITTAAVLAVLYTVASTFQPLPQDVYRCYLKDPFSLQKGWLLWAGIGLAGAIAAIAVTGAAASLFRGESPEREKDALVSLLPLIGSSSVSTACLLGITGVLAPILEETVFRGFFMVSMTKWVPTPVAIGISAAVFALAHLTPGEFPQLFVLGSALGFSYAQTRNLLTPITIHALWNSGVILLLTFLQLQGYDIKELLQTT